MGLHFGLSFGLPTAQRYLLLQSFVSVKVTSFGISFLLSCMNRIFPVYIRQVCLGMFAIVECDVIERRAVLGDSQVPHSHACIEIVSCHV